MNIRRPAGPRSAAASWWFAAVVACLGLSPRAAAQPQAVRPLRTPDFSVDRDSPATFNGVVQPGDTLNKPGPSVVRPAATLGLLNPLDDLDGISFNRGNVPTTQTFLILFSVDRASIGLASPDPALVAQNRPYNVLDQAAKSQAPGDIFMALTPFNRGGPLPFDGFGPGANPNNTLVKNQGDTGGVDKDLDPDVSPETFTDPDEQKDDSDGLAEEPEPIIPPFAPRGAPGADDILFFTVRRDSPSLTTLPGTPSGANIYGDVAPTAPGGEFVYAGVSQLGLVPGPLGDDINALLVFDNGDLIFGGPGDSIIFSLNRGSPSLDEFELSPADLLVAQGSGGINLFAPASLLGLAQNDNIDGLEILPTNNVAQEIFDRAIFRVVPGDYDGNGLLEDADCQAFDQCYSGPGVSYDFDGTLTYTVAVGPGPQFNPALLDIQAGDIVNWIWLDGPHNVVSGTGTPDGAFHSGPPVSTPGFTFTVDFNDTLLDVHPKYQGRYRYYSAPDLAVGMFGEVRVHFLPCATFDLDYDGDIDCKDWHILRALSGLTGATCPLLPIPEFVAALIGGPILPPQLCKADMNQDGTANGLDVQPYVDALLGGP